MEFASRITIIIYKNIVFNHPYLCKFRRLSANKFYFFNNKSSPPLTTNFSFTNCSSASGKCSLLPVMCCCSCESATPSGCLSKIAIICPRTCRSEPLKVLCFVWCLLFREGLGMVFLRYVP